jgi:hypothetical protein
MSKKTPAAGKKAAPPKAANNPAAAPDPAPAPDLGPILEVGRQLADGFAALDGLVQSVASHAADSTVLAAKIDKALKDGKIAALGHEVLDAVKALREAVAGNASMLAGYKDLIGK